MSRYIGHQGGFHGVTARQHSAMIGQMTSRCDVFGATEQTGRTGKPGWAHVGGECKIYYDRDAWDLADHGEVTIRTGPWKRGTEDRLSSVIPWAALTHQNGGSLLMGEMHLPAHLADRNQLRANIRTLEGLEEAFAPIVHAHDVDEFLIGSDLNRDIRLSKNMRLVQEAVDGLGLRVLLPPSKTIRGVLGRRIDTIMTTRRLHTGVSMVDWLHGYDHRGMRHRSFEWVRP